MDFIAVNYYRTLCVSYLPADDKHPVGERTFPINQVDFDQYGYFHHMKNEHLASSEYGAQIDPLGLRTVLNNYYQKYHLPLIVTENGLGTADTLTEDGKVHDDYRIDYLKAHILACSQAIEDGVEMMGYSPWSFMDLLSSHEGFKKRYGFVYINREDHDLKDMSRIKKDSFYWYKRVIETNGEEL
jgi:6-phospho-beta-glucosidase